MFASFRFFALAFLALARLESLAALAVVVFEGFLLVDDRLDLRLAVTRDCPFGWYIPPFTVLSPIILAPNRIV